MSSQILITGATGFIGRCLTRDLAGRGERVRVLARSEAKARALFGDEVEICEGDITDAAALARACAGVETIYHIAGSYRFGWRHRHELWRSNVEGTETLLQKAFANDVETVVHLSSAGVLERPAGAADPLGLLDETDYPAVAPSWSPYKFSKWHAEQRALAWARRGLRVVIASTTCPIGRGDEAPTPTGRMIRDFLRGQFPFYCRTGLNFIGVGDLSEGLQRAAARGRSGERYLLCHENLWLRDFLQLLAREVGASAPAWRLPNGLIRVLGVAGEAADLLNPRSGSARICIETALQAGRVQFFSHAKAISELGWEPRLPLDRAVREAIDWFRRDPELEASRGAPASPLETHVQ